MRFQWRVRLGPVCSGSAVETLLSELVGTPLSTVKFAANATGRSIAAVNEAVKRFIDVVIARPVKNQRRNCAFEVPEVIDAFNIFERRLA